MARQIHIVPTWAVSGTSEQVQPSAATRAQGLVVNSDYDYQTSNWLYRKQGENLAAIRDEALLGPYSHWEGVTGIATTATSIGRCAAYNFNGVFNAPSYALAFESRAATAIEAYSIDATTWVHTYIGNGLPVGLSSLVALDALANYPSSVQHILAAMSGTTPKIYTWNSGWSDTTSTYANGATAAINSLKTFHIGGVGMSHVHVGDNAQAFRSGTRIQVPAAMTTTHFADIAAGYVGSTYYEFYIGLSGNIGRTSALGTTMTALTGVLPSSLSAAKCATFNIVQGTSGTLMVGGVRTDGRGFLAYSTDLGATFEEIDPGLHGLGAVTAISWAYTGAFVCAAAGQIWGGFADDTEAWKLLNAKASTGNLHLGNGIHGGQWTNSPSYNRRGFDPGRLIMCQIAASAETSGIERSRMPWFIEGIYG